MVATRSIGQSFCTLTTPRPARPSILANAEKTSQSHGEVLETVPSKARAIAAGTALTWLSAATRAWAVDREYGILEGVTISLVHPAAMLGLFGATVYAGWLGWQWRRLREVGNEIRDLKKQLPKPDAEGNMPPSPVADQIASLETVGDPSSSAHSFEVPVCLQTRKELVAGGFRDKHWDIGSLLLGGGTFIAVFGCTNTYLRTNKLFPGPHLYSGAAIVVLWAAAAALVPYMQKGNDTARTMHIALNVANVLLFASQIPTGFEIVGKVLEFAAFP